MITIKVRETEQTVKNTVVAVALIRRVLENIHLSTFIEKGNPAYIEVTIKEIKTEKC